MVMVRGAGLRLRHYHYQLSPYILFLPPAGFFLHSSAGCPPPSPRHPAPLTLISNPGSVSSPVQWLARLGAAWIICRNMSDLNNCSVYFVFVSTWYPLVSSGLLTWHCCWWSPVHRRIVALLLQQPRRLTQPHPVTPQQEFVRYSIA